MGETKIFEKALLVEDDRGHALLIKRALKVFVSDLQHAESMEEAQSLLADLNPDIIVTDLNLPDSKELRHIELFKELAPNIPIVVLTSSTALEDAVEAMKLGARDFIVKSFDREFQEVLGLSLSRTYSNVLLEREKLRLQREMEGLRTAIESSNDGLAVSDATGRIIYANSSFRDFVETCGGDSSHIQKLFSDRVAKVDQIRESLNRNLAELSSGAVWSTELTLVEGDFLAYDLSLTVIRRSEARTARGPNEVVLWARDISEQKRRERFQRDILSATTHDLKGPLGAIILSTELLKDLVKEQPDPLKLVVRMASSAEGALSMIDEFLSARRIEEGTFILKPEEQEVGPVLRSILDDYRNMASARNLTLEVKVPEEPVHASFDKLGLARVVGNLVNNAIKFTPKNGTITICLEETRDEYAIEVSDTGEGMEPSEVSRIFARYSRLERHTAVAGSGIGLFIVKSIVGAHGGKIEVTSQKEEGTTFRLELPKRPPVDERGELVSLDFV